MTSLSDRQWMMPDDENAQSLRLADDEAGAAFQVDGPPASFASGLVRCLYQYDRFTRKETVVELLEFLRQNAGADQDAQFDALIEEYKAYRRATLTPVLPDPWLGLRSYIPHALLLIILGLQTYQAFRTPDLFTVPFDVTDNGPDGRAGTGDESTIVMYGMPSSLASTHPSDNVVLNTDRYSRYKTAEVSMNKRYSNRWSASIGGSHTWLTDFPTALSPNNPNLPGVEDRTTWQFKATASYDAPWGIRLSPVLRHQSGVNFARTIAIPSRAGLITTSGSGARATAYVEPANANREDNIWVFDARAEKTINLIGRVRTRLFLDVFNITNSHASETISRATGLSYLKPSAILAPRVARLGFRFLW